MSAIELSDALEGLREQLQLAWANGKGQRVRFRAESVTLTLQLGVTHSREVSGKVRWWLVEGGGNRGTDQSSTQTVVLTLTPSLYDDDGRPVPLDVAGLQPKPGA